jgi:hypothetical protein
MRHVRCSHYTSDGLGVHVPAAWLKDNAWRLPPAERRPTDTKPASGATTGAGLAAMELPSGFQGNFWDDLQTTTP